MRVVLYAPQLSSSAGGVWQYCQWIMRYLANEQQWYFVAPSDLLAEIREQGPAQARIESMAFDEFRQLQSRKFACRLLQTQRAKRVFRWVPFFEPLSNLALNRFYGGDYIAHQLGKKLARFSPDVVHVPVQQVAYRGAIRNYPYVINPHDYQHEYFPEFFTTDQLAYRREAWYRDQRAAAAIVVHSRQTRDDAIRFLGIPDEKVFYAPYGSIDTFPEPDERTLDEVKRIYGLPDQYLFYPARAWPHKNHEVLVRAVNELKLRDIDVQIVFTDGETSYGNKIKKLISDLGLSDQVRFLGRISSASMGALYRLCMAVVVPSMFEQNSGPLLEAIHFGKAVAVSRLPELVDTIGPEGLVFDHSSVEETASVLDRLWCSDSERLRIEAMSVRRRSELTWDRFQQCYRDAYEYAAARGI